MNTEMVARTIQLIIAPVVMISACSILLNGLLAHYDAINNRMRLMARERLELVSPRTGAVIASEFALERLTQIDFQLPNLLRRHKQMHDALVAVFTAILLFIVNMFAIAVSVVSGVDWMATVVLVIFLGAIGLMFVGVLLVIIEVRDSHRAVHYEVRRVTELDGNIEPSR
jgi:hypothetical protein